MAVLLLLAASCSREAPPGNGAAARGESQRAAGAEAEPAGAGAAGEEPGAAREDDAAVKVAVNRRANSAFPMANNIGQFAVRSGCLILDIAGTAFTPIFPGPARYEGGAVLFAGSRVVPGTAYAVGGGRVTLPSPAVEIDEAVLRGCPDSHYLVSGVEPA